MYNMELVEQKDDHFQTQPPTKPLQSQRESACQQNYNCDTPFCLIQIAGSSGMYQTFSLILWCILWTIAGCILLGTPFLVYIEPYACQWDQAFKSASVSCVDYVCSKPQKQRSSYIPMSQISNIATDLIIGDARCQKSWTLDLIESLVYFGSLLGYFSLSMLADNIGRKKSIIICYGISVLGMVLAVLAPNIYLAGIGLFTTGFGIDAGINICFYFITETVRDQKRMKQSTIIQLFFSLGCLANVGLYYWIGNWKLIFWLFFITPSIVSLALLVYFIQETPYFMILKFKSQQIKKSIFKISKINKMQVDQSILDSKIKQLKSKYSNEKAVQDANLHQNLDQNQKQLYNHTFTFIDMFKYRSIRFMSISICAISFFIYIQYYAPLLLISKFSFSIYINALVVSLSEIVIYPFCYYFINKWQRKRMSIILVTIIFFTSFLLIFVIRFSCQKQKQSSLCLASKVLQLLLIFIFRLCASLEFTIFLIYCNELLPTQIRGIGIGFSSALGTIASTLAPYFFGNFINSNSRLSNSMICFPIISLISLYFFRGLPQTLGAPLSDQIQQIQEIKKTFGNSYGKGQNMKQF